MATVKQVCDTTKQPWGGYIKSKDFRQIQLNDGKTLNPKENVDPSIVGTVVDYMTRFIMGSPSKTAFDISLKGALFADQKDLSLDLLNNIKGLDTTSITNACKLVGFDVCYRASISYFKGVDAIEPDAATINNISIMINRCVSFWQQYGPIVKSGFTFEGGYSPVVTKGDGDYLTQDTIWDLKVLSGDIRSKHTLQLLIYYIMGKRSIHSEFTSIKKIGIYNPRFNMVYLLETERIPQDTIEKVSNDVLKYAQKNDLQVTKRNAKSNPTVSRYDNTQFYVGARCEHTLFGKGTILKIKWPEIDVYFDSGQVKRLHGDFIIAKNLLKIISSND